MRRSGSRTVPWLLMLLLVCCTGCGRTTPEPPPETPLARIATGTEVPDILRTVERVIASQSRVTPEPPSVEPLVHHLYSQGWPRTAARLAKSQAGKQSWVFRRVALESGDGPLFWASRNASEPPGVYWQREVPGWYGGERRYRLLLAWPGRDASPERLWAWVFLPLSRPGPETVTEGANVLRDILPKPVKYIVDIIMPAVEPALSGLPVLALLLPESGLPPEKLAMNIATQQHLGISWRVSRLLAWRMPAGFLMGCAPWALENDDDELLFRIYERESFPPGLPIDDWVAAISPARFARLAAGLRRPVLARHHAIRVMADLIGSGSVRLPPGFSEFFEPELNVFPRNIATSAYWLFTELAPGFAGEGAGVPGAAPIIRSRDPSGISGNADSPDPDGTLPASGSSGLQRN